MIPYRNLGGDSAVVRYDCGSDWIEVEFKSGAQRFYRYTFTSAGRDHVEKMKVLANNGKGVNAYIIRHVAKKYETKR